MKKFVIKILIFSLPALLFVIVAFAYFQYSKLEIDNKLDKLSEHSCLLMGDSQMQRLRGDLISDNAANVGSSGEHFYFTYNKLLRFLKNNENQIDTVILGVSIHNFAPVYNRLFDMNFPEGKSSFERYFYFLHLFDKSNFVDLSSKLPIFNAISAVFDEPDWGGFHESENSNPESEIINTAFDIHFKIRNGEAKYCDSQLKYLHKIDSLCTAKSIALILISTPYHSDYKKQINSDYSDHFYEIIESLNHRIYINFMSENIDPNLMSDANHLNITGAKIYSETVSKKLKSQTD